MDDKTGSEILPAEGSVPETLLIPLFARAKESARDDGIIKDGKSEEIARKIAINASSFDGGNMAHVGIISRTEVIDAAVKEFASRYPGGAVINLGAGLDTRITRVDNGKLMWFDVDLPEVIRLRRKFFEETDRLRFIEGSVLDGSWIKKLGYIRCRPALIIAEGLLMYFEEEKVREIFRLLTAGFPGADMYFDAVHRYFVGKSITAAFLWGMDGARDIEKLVPGIELVEQWSAGDLHKERQSALLRIMNILPSTRNRSRIIHVRFAGCRATQ